MTHRDTNDDPARARTLARNDAYSLSRQLQAALAASAYAEPDRARAAALSALHAQAADQVRELARLVQ